MTTTKQALLALEKTGKYVFHGSGVEIKRFDPRQAYTIIDGKNIPDGTPAVFASSLVDYAIFMSLLNKNNCPNGFRSSVNVVRDPNGPTRLRLLADEKGMSQLNDGSSGFVYVFDKEQFSPRPQGDTEYVCLHGVEPLSTFNVGRQELSDVEEIKL